MASATWQADATPAEGAQRYTLRAADGPVSFRQMFTLLRDDDAFADRLSDAITGFDCEACYWELPPVTATSIDNNAEFVLLDAPSLARMAPEPDVFASHFRPIPDRGIAVFANLGGDAVLVAPCPSGSGESYPHLVAFLRTAPAEQQRALWQITAETVLSRLGPRPTWVSTAGLGVAWLHVRLDSRPKYYRYAPYTKSS